MQIGISTACLYPMYTEDSLRAITELGARVVEVFFNSDQELRPSYIKGLRAIADAAGARIVSVHPYTSAMEPLLFFSQYDRRFQDGLEMYKRFWQAANLLGAELVVFHGNAKTAPMERSAYFERLLRVWEAARADGIQLCQENVERCTANDTSFFYEMGEEIPQVGCVLDVKQAVRAGQNVLDMVDAMSGRIQHLHLSDHDENNSCLLPGRGELNAEQLFNSLQKGGFNGHAVVEMYRENFSEPVELMESVRYLMGQLSTYC